MKKTHKMDPNLVSSQKWEITYIAKKFGISPEIVRALKKNLKSRSRRKLYNAIKNLLNK